MTEQAFKRATEIQRQIKKLQDEVEWLDDYAGNRWNFRRVFGFKKVPAIKAPEKVAWQELFDLTHDDVLELQCRRIKLIHELQSEFERLQCDKEDGGNEDG